MLLFYCIAYHTPHVLIFYSDYILTSLCSKLIYILHNAYIYTNNIDTEVVMNQYYTIMLKKRTWKEIIGFKSEGYWICSYNKIIFLLVNTFVFENRQWFS